MHYICITDRTAQLATLMLPYNSQTTKIKKINKNYHARTILGFNGLCPDGIVFFTPPVNGSHDSAGQLDLGK